MEKEFIPYKQALELKELGFDEGCLTYYFTDGKMSNYFKKVHKNSKLIQTQPYNFHCVAPLYQQAFRWFREKYKLDSHTKEVSVDHKINYVFNITKSTEQIFPTSRCTSKYFNTYEEAELEVLKKLIGIVKL